MKWWKFDNGRWKVGTAGLRAAAKGMYVDLLTWMYDHETPLPLDIAHVRVIAGVRGSYECGLLDKLLDQHFTITDDGWRHKLVDRMITRVNASRNGATDERYGDADGRNSDGLGMDPDALRDASGAARQARYRQRRAALFTKAAALGIFPSYNARIEDVEKLIEGSGNPESRNGHVTASHDGYACARLTDTKTNTLAALAPRAPSPAGAACLAMRKVGLVSVNPSHPELMRLLDEGMTVDELVEAASEAVARGKGMAYAMATARGRRRDAAAAATLPAKVDPLAQLVGPLFLAKMRGGPS